MNILRYSSIILFLYLKLVLLEVSATWHMGVGHENIVKEIMRRNEGLNLTNEDPKWIVQRLDHFDDQETRTWNMRYFEHLEYFQQNGPIFIFIGAEGSVYGEMFRGSLLDEFAKETHGAIFTSEHRYYGLSMPLDKSVTENLKYLSSEQALADIAHLIKSIKSQPRFERSKVVAVGGSYAGNLAAWMRTIYPDIVDCAWASSAPVLAKKDFVEYLEQVGEDFMKYGGELCYEKITQIFSRYHELLQTTEGIKQLKQEQNICEETDMTQPLNQAYFFNSKIMLFMGATQSGNLTEIKQLCNDINFEETVVKTDYQCVNYIFSGLQNILSHHIPWVYQICTEFGYFQTTDSNKQPFSNDLILRFYTELCSGFGPDFNEAKIDKAVADTNKFYGGLNPNVTKVVFLHGSVDPWHRLGITKSLSDDVPAFVIEGTSHCADLYRHEPSDPEELIKARDYAERMVKYWLGLGSRPAPFKEYSI